MFCFLQRKCLNYFWDSPWVSVVKSHYWNKVQPFQGVEEWWPRFLTDLPSLFCVFFFYGKNSFKKWFERPITKQPRRHLNCSDRQRKRSTSYRTVQFKGRHNTWGHCCPSRGHGKLRIPPTSMAALDPSSWNHLPCGTERVRKELRVSWRDEER